MTKSFKKVFMSRLIDISVFGAIVIIYGMFALIAVNVLYTPVTEALNLLARECVEALDLLKGEFGDALDLLKGEFGDALDLLNG
jgi:hypothetical protein